MPGTQVTCVHPFNNVFKRKVIAMKLNQLRGTVADRPIDARVVRGDGYPASTMNKILAVRPEVQQTDASRLSDYDKG
jgi:hypothetical protein